jgi:plastocyanin
MPLPGLRLRVQFVFVALTSALLAGCPPVGSDGGNDIRDPHDSGQPVPAVVEIENFAFVPAAITVQRGDSVRWVNKDDVAHTVTSGAPNAADAGDVFESGTIDPGETYTRRFDEVGTFKYFCRFHPFFPQMRDATVTVTE